uniref:triacylglycerol lipase n=1 Tax=Streptococcus ferus TaxID=1345 RepID=UPI00359F15BE
MVTDSEYHILADQAYNVEPSKAKSNHAKVIKEKSTIKDTTTGQSFQVLKVEDNTANGMQAMAVAPVDKAGNVDTSQVVIAYAGTNSTDVLDLLTDVQQVGLGQSSLIIPNAAAGLTEELDTQVETALSFAKAVEKAYPRATITTTGHSLGGSLSMYVSLKQGYASTTYNGPDISQMISDKEIKYMQEHREQFRNYRNPHDIIGNITGNKTKSAIYPEIANRFSPLDDHNLSRWRFNKKGQLIDAKGEVISSAADAALTATSLWMASDYKQLKASLSSGGLTGHEQVYLDYSQASVIAASLGTIAQEAYEQTKAIRDEAVAEAEDVWEDI